MPPPPCFTLGPDPPDQLDVLNIGAGSPFRCLIELPYAYVLNSGFCSFGCSRDGGSYFLVILHVPFVSLTKCPPPQKETCFSHVSVSIYLTTDKGKTQNKGRCLQEDPKRHPRLQGNLIQKDRNEPGTIKAPAIHDLEAAGRLSK